MAQEVTIKKVRCHNCPLEIETEHELLQHIKVHQYQSNFRIPCMQCHQKLKTFKTYKKHKKLCNKKLIEPKTSTEEFFWVCKICSHQVVVDKMTNSDDFNKVKSHLLDHSRKKYNVSCHVCDKSYAKYKSLNAHLLSHVRRNEFGFFSIESLNCEH